MSTGRGRGHSMEPKKEFVKITCSDVNTRDDLINLNSHFVCTIGYANISSENYFWTSLLLPTRTERYNRTCYLSSRFSTRKYMAQGRSFPKIGLIAISVRQRQNLHILIKIYIVPQTSKTQSQAMPVILGSEETFVKASHSPLSWLEWEYTKL